MYGNIFTIEKRLRKAFLKAILIGEKIIVEELCMQQIGIMRLFTKIIVQVFFECECELQ